MSICFLVLYDQPPDNLNFYSLRENLCLDHKEDKNIIYHIFNIDNYNESNIQTYNQFLDYDINNKFAILDFSQDLDSLSIETHKYNLFVIIRSKFIIHNNAYEIFKNKEYNIIQPINNTEEQILLLNRSDFITNIIRSKININALQTYKPDNIRSLVSPLILDSINSKKTEIPKDPSEQNTFYEDSECLFCLLKEQSILVDSFIYMNKLNNKVYSIRNHIIGTVQSYNGNNLKIKWQNIDESTFDTEYSKNGHIFQ